MRYFISIVKKDFKLVSRYRWHYIFNLLLNPIGVYVFYSLFTTIYNYDQSQIILGYTLNQMIWYYAAMNFFFNLVWSEPDKEVSLNIINGYLAILLTHPISIFRVTFINALSNRVTNILFGFLPTFLIYWLLVYPDFLTWIGFAKYVVISMFSFILFFLFSFLIGIASFKLQSIATLQSVKHALVLMSGVCIPFDFFPGILQSIIKALPFKYIYYIPIQFFLNKPETHGLSAFYNTIFIQLIWIGIFFGLTVITWKIAIKRYYSVGG